MSAVAKEVTKPLLPRENLDALNSAAGELSRDQLLWASGYLAGLANLGDDSAATLRDPQARENPASVEERWTILYATETGNSRRIAMQLEATAQAAGLTTRVVDIADYRLAEFKTETRLLIVSATHGLGEPPEGCEPFFEYLASKRAPQLPELQYSVLALGDSSYEDFCTAGHELDERLASLGATRLTSLVECDIDYEDETERWSAAVMAAAEKPSVLSATAAPRLVAVSPSAVFHRDQPFAAEVYANQKITGCQSSKDVRHVELSLQGSGLRYEPGDSLGIWPRNNISLVDSVMSQFGLDGTKLVTVGKQTLPVHEALTHRLELSQLSAAFVRAYAEASGSQQLADLLGDRTALTEYLNNRQVVDVLTTHPAELDEQGLADALRRVTPRLYSIASSPLATDDEVHLTVALLATRQGRFGAVSTLLAEEPEQLPVFVEPNKNFRLPQDGDTPVIMIGPGTGVAPFRAFVEHRQLLGAQGRNWLFFGDRNFGSDFLYQIEWLRHLKQGGLDRLDLAFSRDQQDKVYVQHRIRERAGELFRWLEEGAHVYVCGDLKSMAPDVHEALVDVSAEGLGKNREAGEMYLSELKSSGRYQRDVY
jgi:sulfite reductase (NADPH) flavoprotein alpha-component